MIQKVAIIIKVFQVQLNSLSFNFDKNNIFKTKKSRLTAGFFKLLRFQKLF